MTVDQWSRDLRRHAAEYARTALTNIQREFPSDVWHRMHSADDLPRRPRERTPVFYGSFDWHSCVEMHWLLVRLLRRAGDVVPQERIRAVLDAQFTADGLAAEARFMANPDDSRRERPYGWSWALLLARELARWHDAEARRWSARFAPLADTLTRNYLAWLPKATYPVRYGVHGNSAVGLARALPYANFQAR